MTREAVAVCGCCQCAEGRRGFGKGRNHLSFLFACFADSRATGEDVPENRSFGENDLDME
jgi:hypothetical protein